MEKVIRKARKKYECLLCGREIPIKTEYAYIKITPWCHRENDGFSVWRAHVKCEKHSWEFYKKDVEYDGGIMIDPGNPCSFEQQSFRMFVDSP